MATTCNRLYTPFDDTIRVFWWSIANGESPDPAVVAGFPDITVQVLAITGSPTIIFEGCVIPNDQNGIPAVVYGPCEDPGGTAISFTAAGWEVTKQYGYLLRPRITAGSGVTAVCALIASRAAKSAS